MHTALGDSVVRLLAVPRLGPVRTLLPTRGAVRVAARGRTRGARGLRSLQLGLSLLRGGDADLERLVVVAAERHGAHAVVLLLVLLRVAATCTLATLTRPHYCRLLTVGIVLNNIFKIQLFDGNISAPLILVDNVSSWQYRSWAALLHWAHSQLG